MPPPLLLGIDHVQLAMPPGARAEEQAVGFYQGVLGMQRVPKPPELAVRARLLPPAPVEGDAGAEAG